MENAVSNHTNSNRVKKSQLIPQAMAALFALLWIRGASAQFYAQEAALLAQEKRASEVAPAATPLKNPEPVAATLDVLIEPSQLDFAVLAPNQPASGNVIISNLGSAPVRIASVREKCTCTTHQLSAEVIDPGEHLLLTVTMHGRAEVGPRASSVYVFLEGEDDPRVIGLRYDIARAVRPTPPRLDAERALEGIFAIEAADGRPFRVLSSNGAAPQFVGFDPARDEPRASYTLKWSLMKVACEQVRDWWIVETDHPDAPIVELRVMNRCTQLEPKKGRAWRLSPSLIVLEHLSAGEWTEFTVTLEMNRQTEPFATIDRVTTESGPFEVEMMPGDSPGQLRARIRPDSARAPVDGLLYGTIRFFSGPHSMPIDVVARVGQGSGDLTRAD
jgi:hypothetical protein